MPAVNRSFYANEVHGDRYWDYVSEELPEIVGNFFRISQDPADTFVAGLSMGGYGALKLALTHPDRFAAAATLSGALDLDELLVATRSGWARRAGSSARRSRTTTTSSRCSRRPTSTRSPASTSSAAPRTPLGW